ncbi:MAG: larC 1, partial [Firmicutes bacterium]|nr:larC 1 [Bacillota bacterium]
DLEIPNVLRMQIGEISMEGGAQEDEAIWVLEANIDDQNPQVYEYVMDKLFDMGALDVWLTPIIMKKSRPAVTLSVLVKALHLARITEVVFFETSTIGVRSYPVNRTVADREIVFVDTQWGSIRMKVSRIAGKVCSVSPEYEDCRKIAGENHVPLKLVQLEAIKSSGQYRLMQK